eukprot:365134-Chlamydomonas_euryale.AAC.6
MHKFQQHKAAHRANQSAFRPRLLLLVKANTQKPQQFVLLTSQSVTFGGKVENKRATHTRSSAYCAHQPLCWRAAVPVVSSLHLAQQATAGHAVAAAAVDAVAAAVVGTGAAGGAAIRGGPAARAAAMPGAAARAGAAAACAAAVAPRAHVAYAPVDASAPAALHACTAGRAGCGGRGVGADARAGVAARKQASAADATSAARAGLAAAGRTGAAAAAGGMPAAGACAARVDGLCDAAAGRRGRCCGRLRRLHCRQAACMERRRRRRAWWLAGVCRPSHLLRRRGRCAHADHRHCRSGHPCPCQPPRPGWCHACPHSACCGPRHAHR